jgi:hypothetical protein
MANGFCIQHPLLSVLPSYALLPDARMPLADAFLGLVQFIVFEGCMHVPILLFHKVH